MGCGKLVKQSAFVRIIISLLQCMELHSLDNQLARLPPMGWSTWNAFRCRKCENVYSTDCLSEDAIKDIAESLFRGGFSSLGYEYIIIDDCWQNKVRDAYQRLQPDPQIFPNGMRELANYVHSRNLKLGIFSDLGQVTGSLFPGTHGYKNQDLDARTFAEWEIDYVKMSAFHASSSHIQEDYIRFGDALKKTNRNMVYATSWPVYSPGHQVDYRTVAAHCNTWRFNGDSVASWKSILETMDTYALKQAELRIAHFGAWNDADLLLAGEEGITLDQAKAQMAVWSIMPSPLIFSTLIHKLQPEMRALLQNTYVIDVNQDSLGISGYKLRNHGDVDIWVRPVIPLANGYHSYAVAFVNRHPVNTVEYSTTLQSIRLDNPGGYTVIDLFPSSSLLTPSTQILFPSSILRMSISPTGVMMYKAVALNSASGSMIDRTARQRFEPNNQIIRFKTYDYYNYN